MCLSLNGVLYPYLAFSGVPTAELCELPSILRVVGPYSFGMDTGRRILCSSCIMPVITALYRSHSFFWFSSN